MYTYIYIYNIDQTRGAMRHSLGAARRLHHMLPVGAQCGQYIGRNRQVMLPETSNGDHELQSFCCP
jgi:bacterioferritin-associated ferredoxin